jgi:hypothetical protein
MKTEDKIQQEIFTYYNNTYCLKFHEPREIIFAVPNQNQQKLTSIGVVAGVSDLILTVNGIIVFCEVKTETGKQQPRQIEFENRVKALDYAYIVVRNLEEFKTALSGIINK